MILACLTSFLPTAQFLLNLAGLLYRCRSMFMLFPSFSVCCTYVHCPFSVSWPCLVPCLSPCLVPSPFRVLVRTYLVPCLCLVPFLCLVQCLCLVLSPWLLPCLCLMQCLYLVPIPRLVRRTFLVPCLSHCLVPCSFLVLVRTLHLVPFPCLVLV